MEVQAPIEQFYCELYYQRGCQDSLKNIEDFLEDTKLPQVTNMENDNLSRPVTENEVITFLFSLSDNKEP